MQRLAFPGEPHVHSRTGRRFLSQTRPRAIAVGLLVAIACLSNSTTVAAGSGDGIRDSRQDGTRVCTVATLKGRYPFAASGTLYPPAFGVTEPTPEADSGYQLINGDGTGTDTVTLRIGGVIVLENAVFPTTYTINADCTGKKSVLGGPNFDIFVAPDGSEFGSIATDPGSFLSNIDGRVSRKVDDGGPGCTVATLKGRYPFAAFGTLYPPAFGVTVPTPAADAGYQIINGDGTGTDTVTLRVGDVIVLENVVLPTTYTINADCTGKKSVLGGPNFDIFVAPDGSEFGSIATDPGNYVSNIDHRVSLK